MGIFFIFIDVEEQMIAQTGFFFHWAEDYFYNITDLLLIKCLKCGVIILPI